jgi:hypothetical protein
LREKREREEREKERGKGEETIFLVLICKLVIDKERMRQMGGNER